MELCSNAITIQEVLDCNTGTHESARDLINSKKYDELIEFRRLLKENIDRKTSLYKCSICSSSVYLNCMATNRRFYFCSPEKCKLPILKWLEKSNNISNICYQV